MSRVGLRYLLKNQRINTRLLAIKWKPYMDHLIGPGLTDSNAVKYRLACDNYNNLEFVWYVKPYITIVISNTVTISLLDRYVLGKDTSIHDRELTRRLRMIKITRPDDLYLYIKTIINYLY